MFNDAGRRTTTLRDGIGSQVSQKKGNMITSKPNERYMTLSKPKERCPEWEGDSNQGYLRKRGQIFFSKIAGAFGTCDFSQPGIFISQNFMFQGLKTDFSAGASARNYFFSVTLK